MVVRSERGATSLVGLLGAVVGGAAVSVIIGVAATQVVVNATQPNQTSANVSNVNQPNYAD